MTGQALHVDSDLTFSVDGPSGPSTGSVRAAGSRITVRTSDPVSMVKAVLGAARGGSRTPAVVGNLLAEVGLTVDVIGPKGLVVSMGAGVDSAIGALFGGTRHVRLGPLRYAGPFVVLVLADLVRRRWARR